MDKDIAAANFVQEDPFSTVVEEAGLVPGHRTAAPEDNTEAEMGERGIPAKG
jgi:hypothetical protein